jgi:hypothetical protein
MMRRRWLVIQKERCISWSARKRDGCVQVWNAPRVVRWGRLAVVVSAGVIMGILYNKTGLNFDHEILAMVVLSWAFSIVASVGTTKAYSTRSLGMLNTIIGDILIWTTFLLFSYHLMHISQRMLNWGRGFFTVGAPLLAYGVLRSWWIERKKDRLNDERATQEQDDVV